MTVNSDKLIEEISRTMTPEKLFSELVSNFVGVKATNILIEINNSNNTNQYDITLDSNGKPLQNCEEEEIFMSIGQSTSTGGTSLGNGHHGLGKVSAYYSKKTRIYNVKQSITNCIQLQDGINAIRENRLTKEISDLHFTPCERPSNFLFYEGVRYEIEDCKIDGFKKFIKDIMENNHSFLERCIRKTLLLQKRDVEVSIKIKTPLGEKSIIISNKDRNEKIRFLNNGDECLVSCGSEMGGCRQVRVGIIKKPNNQSKASYAIACRGQIQPIKNLPEFECEEVRLLLKENIILIDDVSSDRESRVDHLITQGRDQIRANKVSEFKNFIDLIAKKILLKDKEIVEIISKLNKEKKQQQSHKKEEIDIKRQEENNSLYIEENFNKELWEIGICYLSPELNKKGDEANTLGIIRDFNAKRLLPDECFPYDFVILRQNNRGADLFCQKKNSKTKMKINVRYEVEDNLKSFSDHNHDPDSIDGVLCRFKDVKYIKWQKQKVYIKQDEKYHFLYWATSPDGKGVLPIFVLDEYIKSDIFKEKLNKYKSIMN